jgi:hypothetical protein
MTQPEIINIYRTKAYTTPISFTFQQEMISGAKYAVFKNKDVFVKLEGTPKLSYSKTEDRNTYALEVAPNVYLYSLCTTDLAFNHAVETTLAKNPSFHEETAAFGASIYNDLDAFNAKLAEQAAKEKEERDRLERKREEERTAQKIAEAETFRQERNKAAACFQAGECIPWPLFESLCAGYGINMHPRTLGAGRELIARISLNKALLNKDGNPPQGVWDAVIKLKAALDAPEIPY